MHLQMKLKFQIIRNSDDDLLQWRSYSGAQWGPHHQPLWPHHQQINLSRDPIPLQTVLCIDTLNCN